MSDLENIRNGIFRHGMAQSSLATIAGVSAPALSRALKGQAPLAPTDVKLLLDCLEQIDRLVKDVTPKVPIDFSQSLQIQQILNERRRPKVFVVLFGGGQFAGVDQRGYPVTANQGLILGGEAAHRICEELRNLGFDGVRAQRVESEREAIPHFHLAWRQQ